MTVVVTVGAGDEGFLEEEGEGATKRREDKARVRAIGTDVIERGEECRYILASGLVGGFRKREECIALVCEGRCGVCGGAYFDGDKFVQSGDLLLTRKLMVIWGLRTVERGRRESLLLIAGQPYGRVIAISQLSTDSIATVEEVTKVNGMEAAHIVVASPFDKLAGRSESVHEVHFCDERKRSTGS